MEDMLDIAMEGGDVTDDFEDVDDSALDGGGGLIYSDGE
jgi:hypothetical protein